MRYASKYILAPHPKAEIRPDRTAIERVLASGWIGQMKVHGHRAQIHLNADEKIKPLAFNRKGELHKLELPDDMVAELRRLIPLEKGWTVVDGEWLKPKKHFFLFDMLKKDGEQLGELTYPQRYALLPRNFISPRVTLLPMLNSLDKCMKVMGQDDEWVEGLVFKSLSTRGFSDTSILRCRKRPS